MITLYINIFSINTITIILTIILFHVNSTNGMIRMQNIHKRNVEMDRTIYHYMNSIEFKDELMTRKTRLEELKSITDSKDQLISNSVYYLEEELKTKKTMFEEIKRMIDVTARAEFPSTNVQGLEKELKINKNMLEESKRILESKNQMVATLERKRNELVKQTEETEVTLAFVKKLLKSMEFIVSDPVCPAYTSNCGKQIRLEEMTKHLVDCQHLDNKDHNIRINTDTEVRWYKTNIKQQHKPLVYKLGDSKQYFTLQGRSDDSTKFSFFMMHHSEEDFSGQYLVCLEIYGETKNITKTKMLRCAPIGICLEDARNHLYTLDISHEDLEKISVRENPTIDESKKFELNVKFSVMVIKPFIRNDKIANRCAMQ